MLRTLVIQKSIDVNIYLAANQAFEPGKNIRNKTKTRLYWRGCQSWLGWLGASIHNNKNQNKNAPFGTFLFYLGWGSWVPRYTITKIKKISLGRFFKIFLIVYSRIGHACRWHSDRSSCPR